MALPQVQFLLRETVESDPSQGWNEFNFFVRAKVTVRAKGAWVNSVFLVQLRKKMAANFRRSTRMKQPIRGGAFGHWMVVVFARAKRERENLIE